MKKENAHRPKPTSAQDTRDFNGFSGTSNPRHLRAIDALLTHPNGLAREALDRAAGCSNGPELVAELRRRGLVIPCSREVVLDRDGKQVEAGRYRLTAVDRAAIRQWFARRNRGDE